jgi:hypothetical protein
MPHLIHTGVGVVTALVLISVTAGLVSHWPLQEDAWCSRC